MALTLSKTTFDGLAARATKAWAERAALQLVVSYPDYFAALSVQAPALEQMCLDVNRVAGKHGITGERDVYRLCLVAISLGHRFWLDPRFRSYIEGSLANDSLPVTRRPLEMAKHTRNWLTVLWGQRTVSDFGAALVALLQTGAAQPDINTLRRLLPGHWSLFTAELNQQLFDWQWKNLPHDVLTSPAQKLVFLACSLAHGTSWLSDPQYAIIAAAVKSTPDASELAAKLAPIYEALG